MWWLVPVERAVGDGCPPGGGTGLLVKVGSLMLVVPCVGGVVVCGETGSMSLLVPVPISGGFSNVV